MLTSIRDILLKSKPDPALDTRRRLAESVILGRDDILFHHDGWALAQVTGQRPLSPAILNHWISSIETRQAWCEARGIAFRFLMVPEKHVVYSDKLPANIVMSENRPALQLLAQADQATRRAMIYPLAELIRARERADTYYRTDSHWNTFGAFVGYQLLMRSLATERPMHEVSEDEIGWTPHPVVGDLGVRLDPERGESTETLGLLQPAPVRTIFQNKLFARGALVVYENDRPGLPRGILFRDSFAMNMISLLAQSFSRLVVVGTQSVHYDLMRAERPDIVIAETCERFLGMPDPAQAIELPRDLDGPDFPTFVGASFESLRGA